MLGLGLTAYLPHVLYLGILLGAMLSLAVRPIIGICTLALVIPLQYARSRLWDFPLGEHVVDILLLCILVGSWVRGRPLLPKTKFRWHVIALGLVTYLTLWIGPVMNEMVPWPVPGRFSGTPLGTWIVLARMLVIFFVAAANITNTRELRLVLACMLVSYLWVNRGFYNTVRGRDTTTYSHQLRSRTGLGYAGPNGLAAFQAQCSLFLLGLFGAEKSKKVKIAMAVAGLTGGIALLFSYSRAAWVGFALGLLYLGIFRIRILLPLLLIVGLVWQAVFPGAVRDRITMTYEEGQLDASAAERLGLWKQAIELTMKSPVLGIGFDAFHYYRAGERLRDTHNMYLKALAETGLVGFLLLVGLWVRAFFSSHRLFRTARDPSLQALGLGFAAYMLALMVVNMFGDRWSYFEVSGFTWLLLAMVAQAPALAAAEAAPALAPQPAPQAAGSLLPAPAPRTTSGLGRHRELSTRPLTPMNLRGRYSRTGEDSVR